MATEIKVPSLGKSVTEATVAKWLKRPGEAVAIDEPVVELETDKVTVEVPAPAAGTLAEILAEEGANLPVGAVLGRIGEGAAIANPPASLVTLTHPSLRAGSPLSRIAGEGVERSEAGEGEAALALERSGPAVRKLIAESGLDAAAIVPTGPGDRITKADVIASQARPTPTPPAAPMPALAPAQRPLSASARCGCG